MAKYDKLAKRLKEYMAIEAMSRYEEPVVEALKKNTASKNFEYSRDGFGSLIIKNKTKVKNAIEEQERTLDQLIEEGDKIKQSDYLEREEVPVKDFEESTKEWESILTQEIETKEQTETQNLNAN